MGGTNSAKLGTKILSHTKNRENEFLYFLVERFRKMCEMFGMTRAMMTDETIDHSAEIQRT